MKLYLCLDNFPAENQKLPGKGRSCTSVWTTSRLKIRHHRKRAAWYTHISGKHGLADCQFVTSLLYSSGIFLLLLKNNSFEQWPSISDYIIYLFFFIILEDWIYFRDNKIVRWFHKKKFASDSTNVSVFP